jgi:hypothetical protein
VSFRTAIKLLTPFILKLLKDASLTTSVRRGTWGCYSPRVSGCSVHRV